MRDETKKLVTAAAFVHSLSALRREDDEEEEEEEEEDQEDDPRVCDRHSFQIGTAKLGPAVSVFDARE